MTEREKMLAGELYDPADSELIAQWHKAKNLTRDYNNLPSDDLEGKNKLLYELLGGRGNTLWITAPFFVDYGNNIFIGENCEINMNCIFLDCNTITIGNNCGIAPGVQILTAFHPTIAAERVSVNEQGFSFWKTQSKPVKIGNDVWLGAGSMIMPGVTIGNNVVIGAGSVVTKDIPDNVVAYGNPCRVMRKNS